MTSDLAVELRRLRTSATSPSRRSRKRSASSAPPSRSGSKVAAPGPRPVAPPSPSTSRPATTSSPWAGLSVGRARPRSRAGDRHQHRARRRTVEARVAACDRSSTAWPTAWSAAIVRETGRNGKSGADRLAAEHRAYAPAPARGAPRSLPGHCCCSTTPTSTTRRSPLRWAAASTEPAWSNRNRDVPRPEVTAIVLATLSRIGAAGADLDAAWDWLGGIVCETPTADTDTAAARSC